jgi:hypothetical protein
MRRTPKDVENLETIQTFVSTASNAVALTISKLKLELLPVTLTAS